MNLKQIVARSRQAKDTFGVGGYLKGVAGGLREWSEKTKDGDVKKRLQKLAKDVSDLLTDIGGD